MKYLLCHRHIARPRWSGVAFFLSQFFGRQPAHAGLQVDWRLCKMMRGGEAFFPDRECCFRLAKIGLDRALLIFCFEGFGQFQEDRGCWARIPEYKERPSLGKRGPFVLASRRMVR